MRPDADRPRCFGKTASSIIADYIRQGTCNAPLQNCRNWRQTMQISTRHERGGAIEGFEREELIRQSRAAGAVHPPGDGAVDRDREEWALHQRLLLRRDLRGALRPCHAVRPGRAEMAGPGPLRDGQRARRRRALPAHGRGRIFPAERPGRLHPARVRVRRPPGYAPHPRDRLLLRLAWPQPLGEHRDGARRAPAGS